MKFSEAFLLLDSDENSLQHMKGNKAFSIALVVFSFPSLFRM